MKRSPDLHEPSPDPVGDEQSAAPQGGPKKKQNKPGRKKSQGSVLVELVRRCGRCTVWHTADSSAYVSVPVNGHLEHWPVRSKSFRLWLLRQYFARFQSAPGAQAVQDAIGTIEGEALFGGRQHDVHVRVAEHGGSIYVDLCDPQWRAVEITSRGWRVVSKCPVRFRRAKAMLALPMPVTGGTVDELRSQLGVGDYWPLVGGWLMATLRPIGPYPVQNLYAEQGAGKTTLARKLKLLVDPNTAPMRCEPKDPRDLMIAANNNWMLALDNLSHLSPWLSDALCRLSTGGGFSTRTLYENDEETIFDAQRPVILTGIEELATRGDLLDRSLIITLPAIPEHQRRPETLIWREFNDALPRMLGTLYNAVSAALSNMPNIRLDTLPRMADFAVWATAAEAALEMSVGTFMDAYTSNRADANELAVDASMIGKIVLDFTATTSYWTGTASELLAELNKVAGDQIKHQRGWPTSGRHISGALKRLTPNLRELGLEVEMGRTKKGRFVSLTRKGAEKCVISVTSVATPENHGFPGVSGDAGVTMGDAGVTQETPGNDAGDDGDAKSLTHSNGDPEERAAIMEFDGGMSRDGADRLAGIRAVDSEKGESWDGESW